MLSRRFRSVRLALVLAAALAALLLGPLTGDRSSAQEVLTNDSIIGMVKAGEPCLRTGVMLSTLPSVPDLVDELRRAFPVLGPPQSP